MNGSLAFTAAVAIATVVVIYGTNRLLAGAPAVSTYTPFMSGHPPTEHALSRFHARWYPASIVFLAFDVEMLFMYPWTLVVAAEGSSAVIEMFGFLGVLLVAVGWAKREGAFRWV